MKAQANATRRIDVLLAEYGESHQNPTNKAIHWVAVPVIAWSVIAILWVLPTPALFRATPYLNWATIACALATIYYLTLSVPLAIGMAVFSAIAIAIIRLVETNITTINLEWIAGTLFVAAWVFQFAGHEVEGRKPSFFKDLQFLLIGPLWLLASAYRRFGLPY
ncbi:MAG TPA: Mpo1-like protein [Xanthobacteraceae bacterium]|nr:Mpo1-like protein [Xanthobacteraceae bacterium]